ncbi:hypothetical protein AABB24_019756 [Solanum stoloniferum]|uniref:Uncharacterized protein n=1 Tax=Solanum stoloniferum TaxID=62892 RepID=A0ABD2T530_9SOLN
MAEHPYFTSSKDPKDSFSDQCLSKGKEKVGENVENTNLTEITVNDPIIVEQNKLITQLFRQIAEMRAEMDKTRNLTNLAIVANTPTLDNERPPLYFPTSDPVSEHFPNNSSTATIPKPPIIDLTTPNPHHASSSHQKLPTSPNPNTNTFQNFPLVHQTLTQIVKNPPTTRPIPLKIAFHLPIYPESYHPFTTHVELDHYEKNEKEWKVIKGKTEQSIREEVMDAIT